MEIERPAEELERAKVEQGKLYRAAQALGSALSEREVVEAAVRAAREIASFDLAAVTVWDENSRMHEVCAARSCSCGVKGLLSVRSSARTPRTVPSSRTGIAASARIGQGPA